MARHFRQPGILAACSKFATANETGRTCIISCYTIYSITHAIRALRSMRSHRTAQRHCSCTLRRLEPCGDEQLYVDNIPHTVGIVVLTQYQVVVSDMAMTIA